MRIFASSWFAAALAFLVTLSCGTRTEHGREHDAVAALAALDAVAMHEPGLAPLLRARDDAFVRAAAHDREDDASRDRIVSEGWRAAQRKNFNALGARLPDTASGAMDVGASRFSSLHLRVTLADANPESSAHLSAGRVVYPRALASTDRVIVSDSTSVEEFLVLYDEHAPSTFVWLIERPEGIARVTEHEGAFHFEDARGVPKLVMPRPVAYDALGTRIPMHASWNEERRALTVTLPARGANAAFAYPVIVDPKYETSVWFDNGLRIPAARSKHALAFDSVRGETVLFGGSGDSGSVNDTWTRSGSTSTWTRRLPTTPPPARGGHALAFDSTRGEVVLFGGYDARGRLSDTWVWNGAASTWTRRSPATSPGARAGHALVFDSARGEIVLFGGEDGASRLNDTWVWSGASSTWTQSFPTSKPSPRWGAAVAFDSARGEVVLFGGYAGTGLSDTWTWNGASTTWTLRAPAISPPARFSSGIAFDSARGEVVLFAGFGAGFNDTWVWRGATSTWTRRTPPVIPAPREAHALAFDSARGEVVLFGGNDSGNFNDTWTWNGAAATWTRRSPPLGPPARNENALAFDSVRGEVVLFGGKSTTGSDLGDTWVWDGGGSVWLSRAPAMSPRARFGHALAFDSARAEVVLFGGESAGTRLNDTWAWNGATSMWTQRLPATSPPARLSHRLVFDGARREIVLFGGFSSSGNHLNDTWIWSGANATWTPRLPATSPPARSTHAFTYDSVRGEAVVFGGNDNLALLDDTWVWNGAASTWTQHFPATSPQARSTSAMAFDSLRGEAVLFGGKGNAAFLNDTWTWNGATSTWTPRAPTASPPARQRHALAFDSLRGEITLFGGVDATGVAFDDTWRHRTLGGSCATNADCIETSFCTDGVCCNAATCGTCETCAGTSPGHCTAVLNTADPDTCSNSNKKSCSNLGECRMALGVAATNATDCASGFLVDGVCCASAGCSGCQTCDIAKTEQGLEPGRCANARAGSDPKDDCADEGPSSCKHDGTCDGRGSCRPYEKGTGCGNNVCTRNAASGQFCSGAGECLTSQEAIDCGSFACRDGQCPTSCIDDLACAPLHRCAYGLCVADLSAACDGDHTVVSPGRVSVDCAPYRCEGATCRSDCTRKTDCVGDADCTSEGKCVAFASQTAVGSDGGCELAARQTSGNALAMIVALVLFRRRRTSTRPSDTTISVTETFRPRLVLTP